MLAILEAICALEGAEHGERMTSLMVNGLRVSCLLVYGLLLVCFSKSHSLTWSFVKMKHFPDENNINNRQ